MKNVWGFFDVKAKLSECVASLQILPLNHPSKMQSLQKHRARASLNQLIPVKRLHNLVARLHLHLYMYIKRTCYARVMHQTINFGI